MRFHERNWKEIQDFYDAGHTWEIVTSHFEIGDKSIRKALKNGFLKGRTRSDSITRFILKNGARKQSEETKQKLSKIRIKYLTENPDKVPYLINHSSRKSWPETVFENALQAMGITGWTYAYRNGIYEYDFAWTDLKIDVEVDGGTHKTEKVQKIDQRRDAFSNSQGWRVVRFDAERVKKDVVGCINELKPILGI